MKNLKNNKARDALGHVYELYKYGGYYLKYSLLKMFNKIKNEQVYPDIFKLANITSIYKGKGERDDMSNDRGIFNVVKVRSILDKLVYEDKYDVINESMSTSNIGARRNRNIRDHLLVINSILYDSFAIKGHKDSNCLSRG